MLRTLAGEGFRLERMPLRVTAHCVCYCALLRVRGCGCRPNGMELPLSLARGVSIMRCVVNVRGVVDAVINDKRTSIPFCQKTDALTRKSEKNRNDQALTRERRPAKRNLHLASATAVRPLPTPLAPPPPSDRQSPPQGRGRSLWRACCGRSGVSFPRGPARGPP